MPFTTYANTRILDAVMHAAAPANPPTNWYVGLLGGKVWATSQTWTLNQLVVPTTFSSKVTSQGQQGVIFKCTTAGAGSTTTEPTWPTTEGGTVVDNAATFTEVSSLFQAGTFSGEIVGNAYARSGPITPNTTNFPAASGTEPNALSQNGTAISFPTPTADWGFIIGWILADAATVGNIWAWGPTTSALDASSGSSPSFAINALQLKLSSMILPA